MQTFEYVLTLSTGEQLKVVEIAMKALDSRCSKAFEDQALFPILSMCTRVPSSVMNDAKIGHTKPLERLLKTPPVGALMKLDKPACLNIKDCAAASADCTTQAVRRGKSFPECWDYDMGLVDDFSDGMMAAREVARIVIAAWRDSAYVIISE